MRYLYMSLLALAVFVLSPGAQAVEPGFYIGGAVGIYQLKIGSKGIEEFEDGDTMVRVLGGYRIGDNLAVELDYQSLFESQDEDSLSMEKLKFEADVYTVSVRPILPVTNNVEIYGKIGWAFYDVDVKVTDISSGGSGSSSSEGESESDFYWGAGVDVNFGQLSVRGEMTRIQAPSADFNLISIGALFRF